jgi:serine/threonine protein kinase
MIGLRLNNYEVISPLGEGGMGTVYLARHTFMGRRVAIKFLRSELLRDHSIVARFLDESRATNAIQHPNIIDIIDVGLLSDGSTPYLMMEYLDGESLSGRLARARPLPIHEAVEIACQTASALAAAHARQIIHRDLKPDNLHLLRDETRTTNLRVKVLDFGIAKLRTDARGGAVRTQTGAILGTPLYMSPEQCLGISAGIDHRTDIYALGTILYEMLCGQPPFPGEGLGDILLKQMSEPPAPLRTRVPEIPELLDRAVLCALAKKRDDRFDSMDEFARAIREHDPKAAKTAQVAGNKTPCLDSQGLSATPFDVGATLVPVLLPVEAGSIPVPAAFPPAPLSSKPESAKPGGFTSTGAHTTLSSTTGQMRVTTKVVERRKGRRAFAVGITVAGTFAVAVAIAVTTSRSSAPAAPRSLAEPVAVAPALAPLVPPPQPVAPPHSPAEIVAAPVSEDFPAPILGRKASRHRSKGRHDIAISIAEVKPAVAPAPLMIPAAALPQPPGGGPKGGSKW